jgi:ABC-type hemin transport system substrate-binding protein
MPGETETLFALGAGNRVVVKVEDIANYPPEARKRSVVATYQGVDSEKIVGLTPDLVIVGSNGGTPQAAIDQLRNLNLPVLAVYAADVDGVLKDIELTGQGDGDGEAAKDLTASMRAQFDQVAAATKSVDKARVFYETGNEPALYGVADDSFVSSMIALAGAEPLTTGSSTNWEMPQEKLIAADPQVILLGDAAYGVSATDVAARPGWSTLTAVKGQRDLPDRRHRRDAAGSAVGGRPRCARRGDPPGHRAGHGNAVGARHGHRRDRHCPAPDAGAAAHRPPPPGHAGRHRSGPCWPSFSSPASPSAPSRSHRPKRWPSSPGACSDSTSRSRGSRRPRRSSGSCASRAC